MVAKDRQGKTDSSKVEVGEIDTRAPFQSVKDAVNLFGDRAFSRVLVKETKLHLAQKELDKLKERLRSAETTRTGALSELERAKRTVDDLTKKLEVINEAKESAIKATEAATDQAKQLDVGETNINSVLKQDLENTKEQYAAVFKELDAAKQELRRIRHDCEAVIEEKTEAGREETEAEIMSKAGSDRVDEISNEIISVKEMIEQVKLATIEAQQQEEKIYAEKNVHKLAHKAALEESAKKLLSLREQIDPKVSKDLETQFAETNSEIKKLQSELENARISDIDALKNVTVELDGAKESLQKVAEEELSLKTKIELESACVEEAKVTGASDEMTSTLQQLVTETETAKKESEDMKQKAEELKKESEETAVVLEEKERKLVIALREAEEAKTAELKALDEIKLISERTDSARASTSGSGSKITISREEFESLSRKAEESEKLAGMKVEAAMAQIEAVRASEKEAVKRLEATQKEIDELKAQPTRVKAGPHGGICSKSSRGRVEKMA
ncbi:WEB family protein [Tanacetum coccineum]|uniref:WEB family protein n=1 Tax=Tanacetum coccineum TaxID=301880 RepID=A0ABQ5I8C3_9ASTR